MNEPNEPLFPQVNAGPCLSTIANELKAIGVRDVKFCYAPDATVIREAAAKFMTAYLAMVRSGPSAVRAHAPKGAGPGP